jgi:hypothetical protein
VASRRDERLDPGELGAQLGGERLGIPSLDQRAREALEDGDATRVRDVAAAQTNVSRPPNTTSGFDCSTARNEAAEMAGDLRSALVRLEAELA